MKIRCKYPHLQPFLIRLSIALSPFVTSHNRASWQYGYRKIIKLLPHCSWHPDTYWFCSWPRAPAITDGTSAFSTVLFLGGFSARGLPLFLSIPIFLKSNHNWLTCVTHQTNACQSLSQKPLWPRVAILYYDRHWNQKQMWFAVLLTYYFAWNYVLIPCYCSPSVRCSSAGRHCISNAKDCYYGAWNENQMDVWNSGNYNCEGCSTKCSRALQQSWRNANDWPLH